MAELSHWTGEPTDPASRAFLADVGKFIAPGAAPAWNSGLAGRERPADPLADIRAQMYLPEYPRYA